MLALFVCSFSVFCAGDRSISPGVFSALTQILMVLESCTETQCHEIPGIPIVSRQGDGDSSLDSVHWRWSLSGQLRLFSGLT